MAPAAMPLPSAEKRALRPSRSPRAARPTSARLIAAMEGDMMALAKPCSTLATNTGSRLGSSARVSALVASAMQAAMAARRLLRIASTMAPPGNWLAMEVMVPTLRASPIWPWVQAWEAR